MRRSITILWIALGLLSIAGFASVSASETTSHPDDIYWDNSMSPSFPGVDGTVYAMTVFDGKLIVAGTFTVAGGIIANNIAAWDGTSWSPLGIGMDGEVHSLTVYNGDLVAGGTFTTDGGTSATHIASWDGTSWSPLGSGMDGSVNALTVYDSKLIAGGGFTRAGGEWMYHIASWDGINWSPLGSGMDGWVSALTVYNDNLVAGGSFSWAGETTANCIASWDGTSWSPLGAGMSEERYYPKVNSLTVYNGNLIAAGMFTTAGGTSAHRIASWDGTSWSPLGTGLGTAYENSGVSSLTVYNGSLVAGGSFRTAGGKNANLIASWDGTGWSPLGQGTIWNGVVVYTLAVYNSSLVAGGHFTTVGGTRANHIASCDGTNWFSLGTGIIDHGVTALTVYDGSLIAGGYFRPAGGASANGIASWDGTNWSTGGVGTIEGVNSLTVYNGSLIAGGYFWTAGATIVSNIASWDGSSWSSLGGGMGGRLPYHFENVNVAALAVYNGSLIAGGYFWTAGATIANNIASWDGMSWSSLGTGMSGGVYCLTVYKGNLIAGGEFTTAGGTVVNHIASWDGSKWSPLGAGTDGGVYSLTVYNGHLIAGGNFSIAGGVTASCIASWDGSSWSPLGSGMGGRVWALTVYDRHLIAGADCGIASWDGTDWSSLGSGVNGGVGALAVYKQKLMVGGEFLTAGNKVSAYLAAWTKRTPMIVNPEIQETYVDVRPGLCPNPLYGRDLCRGKSVIPVGVLGTATFDVEQIDPSSVTLCGVRALEWSLADVSAPTDKTKDSCACTTDGPDGYPDLLLKFDQCAIESAIKPPPPPPIGTGVEVAKLAVGNGDLNQATPLPIDPPIRRSVLILHGQLQDGGSIEGYDCLELPTKVVPAITPIDDPEQAGLRGNYPNPFNPTTTIEYSLPTRSHVVIELFNIVGQRIRTLVDETKPSGVYEVVWNGTDNSGQPVSSGVYLYRLRAGDILETKKMVLLK